MSDVINDKTDVTTPNKSPSTYAGFQTFLQAIQTLVLIGLLVVFAILVIKLQNVETALENLTASTLRVTLGSNLVRVDMQTSSFDPVFVKSVA
jgi:hypothetical protein